MTERFGNLINGKPAEAMGGGVLDDINPANRSEALGAFPRSDYRDVDRAVEVARAGRKTWGDVPPLQRAALLLRTGELLRDRQEAFVELMVREAGKVKAEATAEVREVLEGLAGFASDGAEVEPPRWAARHPGERLAFGMRVPIGVVAVITSWCHPLGSIACRALPALAAGCPVVLKPAEDSPLTALRFAELLLEAGIPPAALGVVHGTGDEAGASLVRHPDVALVAFSGSASVGREVAIACAAGHKPVWLDLGGRSATLVLDDADLEGALEGAVRGAMAASGQRRAPAARVLVHRKVIREFSERLTVKVQSLRVGEGMSPGVEVGPLINDGRLKRTHAFTRVALKDGAKLLCGGEVLREGEYRKGFFYAPTLLAEVTPAMRAARDPASGPILGLVQVGGMEEGLEAVERLGVRVGLAIYTQRLDRVCRAIEGVPVRRVTVNAPAGDGEFGPVAAGCPGPEAYEEWRSVVLRPGRGGRRAAGNPSGPAPADAAPGAASAGPDRPRA